MTFSRDVKKNSPGWLRKQADYVAWWAGQLDGLDLRRVSIGDHLKPALAKASAVPHRTATIKAIYSWLRKEKHLITAAQDPTYGALPVPHSASLVVVPAPLLELLVELLQER